MSIHMNANSAMLAQGLIDTGINLTGELEILIKAVLIVIVLGVIAMTAVKTRMAAAAVAGSILVGGAVIWGVANINIVSDRVGEDLGAPSVVQIDPIPASAQR